MKQQSKDKCRDSKESHATDIKQSDLHILQ